jgi:hypothetical protein
MAEQLLSPADDAQLLKAYDQTACHTHERPLHERLVSEVSQWENSLLTGSPSE